MARPVWVARPVFLSDVGGETSSEWAKRPGGETSWWRNVQGAKRPVKGRNVKGAKRPVTVLLTYLLTVC